MSQAKEWARDFRARNGLDHSLDVDLFLEQHLLTLPDNRRDEARSFWSQRNGLTIGEILDSEFERSIKDMSPALALHGLLRIATETAFVSLPTFETTAIVGRTPKGDNVAVLHEGLFHLLHTVCWWYVAGAENEDFDPDYVRFRRMQNLRETLLLKFTSVGLPEEFPIKPHTAEGVDFARTLSCSATNFILAHEVSHIFLRHAPYGDNLEDNHKSEFDADVLAMRICIDCAISECGGDNYAFLYGVLGPFIALGALALISPSETKTHPSPQQRIVRLQKTIENIETLIEASKILPDLPKSNLEQIIDSNNLTLLKLRVTQYARHMDYLSESFSGELQAIRSKSQSWRYSEFFEVSS